MMYNSIKNFHTQFAWKPKIENAKRLKKLDYFIISGMGGSHLAADLIRTWKPEIPIYIHEDYGLPPVPTEFLKKSLLIASSYSGNTEEVLDFADAAHARGLALVSVAVGGKLLERAVRWRIPYIQLPATGIQPRSALGYSLMALLKLMREFKGLHEAAALSRKLNPSAYSAHGKELAKQLKGYIPVIYTSTRNSSIAYNWKIKFNETAKIPAFYNILPELNHNEMTGFDVKPITRKLTRPFYFILLKDRTNHSRIQKRMKILEKLYRERGLPMEVLELKGKTVFDKIFTSLILADWTAYYTAEQYGVEPEQVPMVEEFKRSIRA